MTTDLEHEESVQEPIATVEEPPVALEELLEFARERVEGDKTRCPGCNLFVPISARRCQHCESNIEANNALVRETLRHIDEIVRRLDNDGRALDRAWRSMKNRMKRMFGRTATIKGIVSEDDTHACSPASTPVTRSPWSRPTAPGRWSGPPTAAKAGSIRSRSPRPKDDRGNLARDGQILIR
jgi:hypothetical protein